METTLYLIRHGQTATNRAQIIQGWDREPLNARGRWQAERTGERLAGAGIAALYASPLDRARETATIIGPALGLTPALMPGLREMNTGRVSGLHGSQFILRYPRLWWAWVRDDSRLTFPGGDTLASFYLRAYVAIGELVARHPGQAIVAVAHGGSIAGYLSHQLDGRGSNRAALRLRNCAICRVEWAGDGQPQLASFNDTAHLQQPRRTERPSRK